MIRGEPTLGKTTCFKKICFDWASLYDTNQDTQSTEGLDLLKPYTLQIPVILKLVEPEATWKKTVQDQIGLSDKHLQTLEHLLETQPEKILFIFDGFDEYNEETSKELTKIKMGKMFRKAYCVITSRPEAVSRIKQWDRKYKEAELDGFSDEHIEDYIQQFFAESKEKGEKLLKLIFPGRSSYLLPLAQNPGNLCMICILHNEGRKIGENREQLYEEIVAFILSRWEEKYKKLKYKTDWKDILNKYAEILLRFGELAYSYDENQKMKLNFTIDDVRIKVGKDAMDYGFLIQPRPMSCGSGSVVLFSHKTIQEYLAGYYIVHKEMESFKKKCKDMKFMEAEKSLMRFIMYEHLTPDGAAKFVADLIKVYPTILQDLLQWSILRGYPHEVQVETVIIQQHEYKFPSCVITSNQQPHQEYSKYVTINKGCVTIKLPQIQNVESLEVRGDGEISLIKIEPYRERYETYITCCRECEVSLEVEAIDLRKLCLININKVGVLNLKGTHRIQEVRMDHVNLNGCLSRSNLSMTSLQSLSLYYYSLRDSDLSDLATCFKGTQTSTGLSYFIYSYFITVNINVFK